MSFMCMCRGHTRTPSTGLSGWCAGLLLCLAGWPALAQDGPLLIFAVITEPPENKKQITAQVFAGGRVEEANLVADEGILQNIMWKKLEICHSLKVQALKVPEGYRIVSFRVVGAGMLPMSLQGVAGDCLLRKALEYAPLLE